MESTSLASTGNPRFWSQNKPFKLWTWTWVLEAELRLFLTFQPITKQLLFKPSIITFHKSQSSHSHREDPYFGILSCLFGPMLLVATSCGRLCLWPELWGEVKYLVCIWSKATFVIIIRLRWTQQTSNSSHPQRPYWKLWGGAPSVT